MKATWKSMKRKICKRLSLLNKTIITLIIKYLSKVIFRQSIGWGKTQVFLSSLIRIHVDMPPQKLYSHCKNYFKLELFILFDCYWYSVHGIFHGILIYFSSPLSKSILNSNRNFRMVKKHFIYAILSISPIKKDDVKEEIFDFSHNMNFSWISKTERGT